MTEQVKVYNRIMSVTLQFTQKSRP